MHSTIIDIHDLADGVDRKQLSLIRQRFIELNQQRCQRTAEALSERQQQFLTLLPLLFHVNHPMLPGYFSHQAACGIHHYTPGKDELHIAKTLARSFSYNRDLTASRPAIDALFVMGSMGTIAQSDTSDLDIWICHADDLPAQALADLHSKCQRISQWAEQHIHLEAHFFLMNCQSFRDGRAAQLSSEGSGSAQHFLLLDEFYRTALWLAGKVPLWWFVPASQENNYDSYTNTLLSKRFLPEKDVIDFGGLPKIPPSEFIGAGIWQLYKSIEAPHKSVLKLLLLETYASDTNSEPLALTFKRAIYQSTPDANALDPYVMIYQRLEEYLNHRAQPQRLELVRRCFYFKVNKPLTRGSRSLRKSWQRLLLESLVHQWHWQPHHLHLLDSHLNWKAPQVIAERTLLVNELSNSYRLLSEINKNNFTQATITNDELMILGRKLHAAFERKAGKIEWINPGISGDLREEALCFVQEEYDGQARWHLYRGSHQELQMRTTPAEPIKRSRNLVELLLWSYCNGILTLETKLDVISNSFQFSNIQRQQVLQSLHQWLPLPLPPVAHEQFKQGAHPTRLLLLFNLGVEPQAELHKKGMQMLSNQRDALGYSGFRENLVLTVDVVQINTWQEIVCRHYASDALINSLLHYLRLLPPGRGLALPELTIRCFSSGQGTIITQRLEELWRDIIACYYSNTRPRNSRYIFEMGDEYVLLQFLQQQPHIIRYKTYEKLLEKLGNAQLDYSPIVIDRYGLRDKPLKLFVEALAMPDVHVFYQLHQPEKPCASLTVIDEKGSLFTTEMPYHNQQTLLRPLSRFIRAAMERQSLNGEVSLQQLTMQSVQFFEVMGNVKQQQGYLEQRKVNSDISQLGFVNIQVIAEPDADGHIRYTLYCNQQEFSTLEYGAGLFQAVARYIFQQRLGGEVYPCYITDLDLSLCRDLIAPQTGLQLSHYLQVKADLENRLTQALQALVPRG